MPTLSHATPPIYKVGRVCGTANGTDGLLDRCALRGHDVAVGHGPNRPYASAPCIRPLHTRPPATCKQTHLRLLLTPAAPTPRFTLGWYLQHPPSPHPPAHVVAPAECVPLTLGRSGAGASHPHGLRAGGGLRDTGGAAADGGGGGDRGSGSGSGGGMWAACSAAAEGLLGRMSLEDQARVCVVGGGGGWRGRGVSEVPVHVSRAGVSNWGLYGSCGAWRAAPRAQPQWHCCPCPAACQSPPPPPPPCPPHLPASGVPVEQ